MHVKWFAFILLSSSFVFTNAALFLTIKIFGGLNVFQEVSDVERNGEHRNDTDSEVSLSVRAESFGWNIKGGGGGGGDNQMIYCRVLS